MVSKLLQQHLTTKTGIAIDIGRPEPPGSGGSGPKLNLFLYEAAFDPSLKNVALDEGQQPPLWLILKYLMTGYDATGDTDSPDAQANLGEGIRALQELSILPLNGSISADVIQALQDNPTQLHVTFEDASSELLSSLMQGSDEKYRFSVGFQVRPVMIAPGEPPDYSLLVGVDYTNDQIIGEDGLQLTVLPSLGPQITRIEPTAFETNETITIFGNGLSSTVLTARIGSQDLAITNRETDRLECLVNGPIAGGDQISAGAQTVSVVETLPSGRLRHSNLLVGHLLPSVSSATPDSITRVDAAETNSPVFGNIDINGVLLGTDTDDVFVALYGEGRVVAMFDAFEEVTPAPAPQTHLRVEIQSAKPVPQGIYRVLVRLNGQQAKNSPEVDLTLP